MWIFIEHFYELLMTFILYNVIIFSAFGNILDEKLKYVISP